MFFILGIKMKSKEELLGVVDRYAAYIKKKMEKEVKEIATSLDNKFDHSKPELQKLLLEDIVSKLSVEVDQYDTQSLIHFVIKFSEMFNLLIVGKLVDYSPLSVNGYVFTPNADTPPSINVEREDSKTPLGKIVIGPDEVIARTPTGEKHYFIDHSYVKDEIIMSVLGNYITKLNTRSYINP